MTTRRRRRTRAVAMRPGWLPTRKWCAALLVALGGLATSAIESGWDATEWKLLVAIAVQAGVTYLLPNSDAPGGVPDAKVKVKETT